MTEENSLTSLPEVVISISLFFVVDAHGYTVSLCLLWLYGDKRQGGDDDTVYGQCLSVAIIQ